MQLPILSGIYTDSAPDFRVSYPVNMVPVANQTGISDGYLRPADGMLQIGTGPGLCRGGINWNDQLYRVMGTRLVRITAAGAVQDIGEIPGTGHASMAYGFDYLAIAANKNLYLYNGSTLSQVTDGDAGDVLDVIWADGYFLFTDGEFLIVTELNDPFEVDPLKYGSSEADPDPIVAVRKIRNEVYAVNRHTIEIFDNVGGAGFPFQRIEGAQIEKGAYGVRGVCEYLDALAILGGGTNEPPAVWIAANGNAQRISTPEIDRRLTTYTTAQLVSASLSARAQNGQQFLHVQLPDTTLVYDAATSATLSVPIWFELRSGTFAETAWRGDYMVWCYDQWNVCDTQSAAFGRLDHSVSTQWGDPTSWEFGTTILFNDGNGALIHWLELQALTGRVALGADPRIWTQYSRDGFTWSQRRYIRAGGIGDRKKRLRWMQQGNMRNWRTQRFGGTSDAHLAFARLDGHIEGLAF